MRLAITGVLRVDGVVRRLLGVVGLAIPALRWLVDVG